MSVQLTTMYNCYVIIPSISGLLEENPKVTQFEDDRFSRMEHFYGADDIDSEALEDLELGDNGEVSQRFINDIKMYSVIFNVVLDWF